HCRPRRGLSLRLAVRWFAAALEHSTCRVHSSVGLRDYALFAECSLPGRGAVELAACGTALRRTARRADDAGSGADRELRALTTRAAVRVDARSGVVIRRSSDGRSLQSGLQLC